MKRRLDRYRETPAARRASVFVGEGDRAAPEPGQHRSQHWGVRAGEKPGARLPGTRWLLLREGASTPRWRRSLRPHLNPGKKSAWNHYPELRRLWGRGQAVGWRGRGCWTEAGGLDSELALLLLGASHDFEAKVIEVPPASMNPFKRTGPPRTTRVFVGSTPSAQLSISLCQVTILFSFFYLLFQVRNGVLSQ